MSPTPDGGGDAGVDASEDAGDDASEDSGEPAETEVELDLDDGTLVGLLEEEDTNVFRGIRYAKAPEGDLRFAPPEPVDPLEGRVEAKEYGLACPQPDSTLSDFGPEDKGEDCLSLNVFAPSDAEDLPVMVFFHGGAFVTGGSASPGYDSKILSREGVIVVTANYRLGALGFLSLPELDAEREGDVKSGNDGIRDQRVALQWVKDHIAAFGGDPENITLFGESAGSLSVCVHNVSPNSADLVQRYIMESGVCIGGLPILSKEEANAVGQTLVDEFCEDEDDVVACLRDLDYVEIANFGADLGISGAGWAVSLDPDGDDIFVEDPRVSLMEDRVNPGEVLMGTNVNEWKLFTLLGASARPTTESDLDDEIAALVGEDAVEIVKAVYPHEDDSVAILGAFERIMTDVTFRCPTRAYANLRSAAEDSTVYLYSFNQPPAYHASELSYVFGIPNSLLASPFKKELSETMQRYWTRFAATGDPNGDDDPTWNTYDADGSEHLDLEDPTPAAGMDLAKEQCDMWDALAQAAAQDS